VPGGTLREELSRGPLPVARVLDTGLAIARALSAAHDRGIVHRDLKPENVIRTPAAQIKILDFGLAQFRSAHEPVSHLTDEGVMLGTPAYMSPEQIRGEPVDARADLFSFGVMLYELTSGASPFAGSSVTSTIAKILEARPPRLAGLNPGSAAPTGLAALDDIVDVCLRKRPDDRYESTHQLVAALERAAAGTTRGAAPAGPATGDQRDASNEDATQNTALAPSWWWQFHQAATSLFYLVMLIPLSFVRQSESDTFGLILFLAGLVSALVASTLRLHVWFTFRSYPAEWSRQRHRTRWWIRTADVSFVVVQMAAAALLLTSHPRLTMILVAAAVAEFLAFAVIEPATTRAAFRR
jgi:serine/threonine protein kinase